MSEGRSTALALVVAILLLELALSGRGLAIWHAAWSGPYALGQGIHPGSGAGTSGSGGGLHLPTIGPTQPGTPDSGSSVTGTAGNFD